MLDCLIAYALLLCFLYFKQGPLIFTGSSRQGKPETRLDPVPTTELITLHTATGDTIHALFGAAQTPEGRTDPDAAHRPTLLYFYGNGGALSDCPEQLSRFRRLGANVLIPDYVGFGASTGTASEKGCYATADAAYDYLLKRPGIDPKKIVSAGASLGGAISIDLASRKPVAGLITFMTFTSMAEMGSHQYPIVPLPIVRVILKHKFLSEMKMPGIHCPILIIHGRSDNFISYSMSDRLAKAAGGPVTRVAVDGAGHNDLFTVGRKQIYPAMELFLKSIKPSSE